MNKRIVKGNAFNIIKKQLPKIELSNEYIFHNKVHILRNIEFTKCIPKGKETFLWFKHDYSRNENKCYVLCFKNRKVYSIVNLSIPFDKFLTIDIGTILYSTQINENIFVIRDVLYYKGVNMKNLHYRKRLETMLYLLEYQIYKKNMFFTCMHKKGKESLKSFDLPYPLFSLEYIDKNGNSYLEKVVRQKIINKYLVIADIQNDIYHAYTLENKYVGILNIPDYKTSCYMNSIYRNIRENENIDYIEESEDEEEFQNINVDKYIKKDVKCIIECEFMNTFKMWKPVRIISTL